MHENVFDAIKTILELSVDEGAAFSREQADELRKIVRENEDDPAPIFQQGYRYIAVDSGPR